MVNVRRTTIAPGRPWRWLSLVLVVSVLYLSSGCSAAEDTPSNQRTFDSTESLDTNRPSQRQPPAKSVQTRDAQVKGSPTTRAAEPAVGLNKIDLFLQYLGHASGGRESGYQTASYQRVTQAMAKKAIVDAHNIGVTYLRVSATGYFPTTFSHPWNSDLRLWRDDPAAHWALFDRMMSDLRSNDVRIVPVFVWNWTQFPAMTGETASQMINDPNSESYRLLKAYIAEFVDRYKNNPALYFYELTNELNLRADLDNVGRCSAGRSPAPAECEPMGNFTTSQMVGFTSRLAGYVRSLDADHLISSGFSIPRPHAEHLRRKPEFSPEAPDHYKADSLAEFKKNLSDTRSGMDIVSVHFYNEEGSNERFGITGHTNAALLGVIKRTTDELGKELFVGEFGDVNPYVKDDKRALFTQHVLDKIVQLKIPYSAPWVWEYYPHTPYLTYDDPSAFFNLEPGYTDFIISKIVEANAELGSRIPSPQPRDTTSPQVVVTWPLGGWLSCDQSVYAVASENSGAVREVRFFIDGKRKAIIAAPPYRFSLDAARLGFNKHQIMARAFDRSGHVGQYTVTARPSLCLRERLSQLLRRI
jgi:hypothetical protein